MTAPTATIRVRRLAQSPTPRDRILQESLTNAARHGRGEAEIAIAYDEHGLMLSVSNPLAADDAGDSTNGGHGILGMRERATLLGGSLDARREDGRFRVQARLPYSGSAQR